MAATRPPIWVAVGAEVQAVGGGKPAGPVVTISRVTSTQIILSDGTKWRTKDCTQFGAPAYDSNRASTNNTRRIRLRSEIEESRRRQRAQTLEQAASRVGRGYGHAGQALVELRAAIFAIAPDLGLTIDVAPGPPTTPED